jgi:hypothetical protein
MEAGPEQAETGPLAEAGFHLLLACAGGEEGEQGSACSLRDRTGCSC